MLDHISPTTLPGLRRVSTHIRSRALVHPQPRSGVDRYPGLRVLRGREAILRLQPELKALAQRSAQTGEADALPYFLSKPDALRKIPYLLLHQQRGELAGAVLLFEYRSPLGRTGVFSTADSNGRRAVLAAPEQRAGVAARAAKTLLGGGAHLVHIAFSPGEESEQPPDAAVAAEFLGGLRRAAQWTLHEREIPAYLPLLGSYDATLARIGQKTRANLRYYRRRAEAALGCSFVPQASLTRAQFLAFNRECMYAVPDRLAEFRFSALGEQAHTSLRGMRDREGRWLSLVGTRRQNGFVEIDWQMNRIGLPTCSLSTVMRSYLIEHEVGMGSTRLYIEGGTPQPIARSFAREQVAELTVKRSSMYMGVLERFGARLFPAKNYVGQILANRDLQWHIV